MDDLHRRLLDIGFAAGSDLQLVLAGGYAMVAHGFVERPSKDIDFATNAAIPMPELVARLASAYERAGYDVKVLEGTQRMARMVVAGPGGTCEVDILKEAIGPPARLRVGPVLSLDDAVGLKMRALHDRAAHRDFIDIHAANQLLTWAELERLCARHTVGFGLAELADRLATFGDLDPRTFQVYGVSDAEVAMMAAWAVDWESDLRLRLAAGETGPVVRAGSEWDAYLDEEPSAAG